jgi:hypothetical protein
MDVDPTHPPMLGAQFVVMGRLVLPACWHAATTAAIGAAYCAKAPARRERTTCNALISVDFNAPTRSSNGVQHPTTWRPTASRRGRSPAQTHTRTHTHTPAHPHTRKGCHGLCRGFAARSPDRQRPTHSRRANAVSALSTATRKLVRNTTSSFQARWTRRVQ